MLGANDGILSTASLVLGVAAANGNASITEITVADGKLYAELKGREKIQLVAQSNTYFTGFFNWQVEFISGPNGVPAYLNDVHVSGNYRSRRLK